MTDYLDVIESPMDLTTMLQKIDGHQYQTCAEYLLDIDLITSNALEYNPNADNFDRLVRHRACALKDCANSLIKSQLDPDFEKVRSVVPLWAGNQTLDVLPLFNINDIALS